MKKISINGKWKKILKITAWTLGGCFFLFVCADLTLRFVSSREWVRNYVAEKIASATGRQVQLDRLSVSFFGMRLAGLKLSENGGFDNGTFAGVNRVTVGFSLIHLLHKHIVLRNVAVRGLRADIVKNADGTFNFDDLTALPAVPQPAPEASEPFDWRVEIKHFFMDGTSFSYRDVPAGMNASVENLFLEMKGVSLDRSFPVNANWDVSYADASLPELKAGCGLALVANLSALDFSKASVVLNNLIIRYNGMPATLSGVVSDFDNPSADLTLDITRVTNQTFQALVPDLPEFNVPKMTFGVNASADLAGRRVTVDSFSFAMPGTQASASGILSYAAAPEYDFHSAFDVKLDELASVMPLLSDEYKVSGVINGAAELSNKLITASVALQDVGAFIRRAGTLSGLNAEIAVNSIDDVRVAKLAGAFNGEKFEGNASYVNKKKYIDAVLNMKLKGLKVVDAGADTASAAQKPAAAEQTSKEPPAQHPSDPLPPVNLKLNITSGPVHVPYFFSDSLKLTANMTGLTPALKTAYGTVNLDIAEGEIRDIYKLTEANAVTKVLFMSLGVVSKVINSLNVLDLLSTLAGAVTPGGDQPEKQPKSDGQMPFDLFATSMDFNRGKMTMKKGTFVSDMMSLKISGNTNFDTGKINMQVNAAPGKHYEDGIMPITIAIGGTVDNPKGSMSMLSSAASLVTQTVTNNFASNTVKKGVGGFFGLFKKKKEEPAASGPDTFIPVDPKALLEPETAQDPAEKGPDAASDTTAVPAPAL